MATPKTPRGPRRPVITQAVIQRAQELVTQHRAATQVLAQVTAETAGKLLIQVEVLHSGTVLALPRAGVLRLLAAEITGLEREAKRLGVALDAPEPAPLPDAIAAAAPPPLAGLGHVEPPPPPGIGEGQAPAPLPPIGEAA